MDDRRQRQGRLAWAFAVLATSVAAIAVVPSLASSAGDGQPLLPDLDQAAPTHVKPATIDGSWALIFDSAVDNVGDGPLIIHGQRDTKDDPMAATQRVVTDTGTVIEHPDAGTLNYVKSSDHMHWHLLNFDRYELRRVGDGVAARPDRKTGFCIGDRYNTDRSTKLPAESERAVYTGYCKQNDEFATSVDEGMSVGWGDNYQGRLEGQSIDIAGLDAGDYLLVHRANADGKLQELRTDNNAASVYLTLSWSNGVPAVKVRGVCAESATCTPSPVPDQAAGSGSTTPATGTQAAAGTFALPGLPTMDAGVARYFVRQSLLRRFGKRMRGLRSSCSRRSRISYSCRVRFTRSSYRYTGRVRVRHWLDGSRVTYLRKIDVTGVRKPCPAGARCKRHVRAGF